MSPIYWDLRANPPRITLLLMLPTVQKWLNFCLPKSGMQLGLNGRTSCLPPRWVLSTLRLTVRDLFSLNDLKSWLHDVAPLPPSSEGLCYPCSPSRQLMRFLSWHPLQLQSLPGVYEGPHIFARTHAQALTAAKQVRCCRNGFCRLLSVRSV